MCYRIMTRKAGPFEETEPEPLAVDIPDPDLAGRLVARIACSYPENGIYPLTERRWFREGNCVREIWGDVAPPAKAATERISP